MAWVRGLEALTCDVDDADEKALFHKALASMQTENHDKIISVVGKGVHGLSQPGDERTTHVFGSWNLTTPFEWGHRPDAENVSKAYVRILEAGPSR